MDINKKIEEIRQQPEHIRLRWVWGAVAVSMFFIIIVWIFSLSDSIGKIKSSNNNNELPDMKQSFEEIQSIKENTPSISDIEKDLNTNESSKQNLNSEGVNSKPEINSSENYQTNSTNNSKQ